MPKPGDDYQDVVGAVQRALAPGSQVDVGVWVDGPDGRRDMDVAVRGTKDGKPHLVLIECKDWRVPVGIAVMDSLDSKRKDLGASAAVVFSNSGFTEDARRKAARVGISLAAALKAGDPLVKVKLWKEFIARSQSVDRWSMVVFPEQNSERSDPYSPFDVKLAGKAVVNWISNETRTLFAQAASESPRFVIIAEYQFRPDTFFEIGNESVALRGIILKLECSQGFVRQVVREDVSLGSYDFLTGRVVVPDRQAYMLGSFDNTAWVPCETPPDNTELEPGTFRIDVTLLRFVEPIPGPVADVDEVVVAKAMNIQESA